MTANSSKPDSDSAAKVCSSRCRAAMAILRLARDSESRTKATARDDVISKFPDLAHPDANEAEKARLLAVLDARHGSELHRPSLTLDEWNDLDRINADKPR
jgi:hypothetical protein